MTNPIHHPTYILRRYAWGVLHLDNPSVWSLSNYGGKLPIVPLAEEADLSQYSGPKIVYEYTTANNGTEYYRNRGTMSFAISDVDFERLTRSLNVLQTTFERHDETARDLNEFVSESPVFAGTIGFGTVNLGFTDGGTPAKAEGGMQVGIISIRFDYFVDYAVNTKPDPTI